MKVELTGIIMINEVVKKTTAEFFKSLEAGDILTVTMQLTNVVGRSGGGSYSTEMVVYSTRLDRSIKTTQNKLFNILENNFR